MIHDCAYCGKEFTVLRKDKMYCSRSCKQMAFMKRKEAVLGFIPPKRTSIAAPKRQAASERTSAQNRPLAYSLQAGLEKLRKELHAMVDKLIQAKQDELMEHIPGKHHLSERTSRSKTTSDLIEGLQSLDYPASGPEISPEKDKPAPAKGQADKETSSPQQDAKQREQEPVKAEPAVFVQQEEEDEEYEMYRPIQCKWLTDLRQKFTKRQNHILFKVLSRDLEQRVKWFGIHHRCLLDSVLKLSNLKKTAWSDLAELTNAFIFLTESNYFKALPKDYPLTQDLISLRDKLRNFCLETQEEEYVQFRLKTETKRELLLQRYELALVFPKISFKELQSAFETEYQKQKLMEKEREAEQPEKEKPWRARYRALKRAKENAA